MMEAGSTPYSRTLSRQALATLQEHVTAAPSEVPRKSRPSSRVSVGSTSSPRLGTLQNELAETERLMTATRQQQWEADVALEGVMGERHAFDHQLLQRARAAARGRAAAAARRPSPLQHAEAAVPQGTQQQAAGVPDDQYQELLSRYQDECEARQAAQELLWELQGELSVAVEEREAVVQTLQGIQLRFAGVEMDVEDQEPNHQGQYFAGGGEEAFDWGGPEPAEAGDKVEGATTVAADAAASEEPPSFEELKAAWHAVRAENEALQAEVQRTQVERDAVLTKLDKVELSLAALHKQEQQQQPDDEAAAEWEGEGAAEWEGSGAGWDEAGRYSPLPANRVTPDSTVEGGSAEVTPVALMPQLLQRPHSITPDPSLDLSLGKSAAREGKRQQEKGRGQQPLQEHGQQNGMPGQEEGMGGSRAGVVEAVVADVLDSQPAYRELKGVLQRLSGLVEELLSGQAGPPAPGAGNRAVLAALRRHVGELQARSAVVFDELEASHAVVEELQGALGKERRIKAQLEGRLAAVQYEARVAERERCEMRQHLQELQDLVEAAIEEAEGSWALLQKVTAEEGRGQKLKVGELWTQLMEAEQRATSALRTPKTAPAASDGSSQQQRRMHEAWRMLESGSQQGDGEVDSAGVWKRKLAQRSASSLRSRLASLNHRFHHDDGLDYTQPPAAAAATDAAAQTSAAATGTGGAGVGFGAAQLQPAASMLLPTEGSVSPTRVLSSGGAKQDTMVPDTSWTEAAAGPLAAPRPFAGAGGWTTQPAAGAAGIGDGNGSFGANGLAGAARQQGPGTEAGQPDEVVASLQPLQQQALEGLGEASTPAAGWAGRTGPPSPAREVVGGIATLARSTQEEKEEQQLAAMAMAMPFPRGSPVGAQMESPGASHEDSPTESSASTASTATPPPARAMANAAPDGASSVRGGRGGPRRGGSPPLPLSYSPAGLHSTPLVPRSRSARGSPVGAAAPAAGGALLASPGLPYFLREEGLPAAALAARFWWLTWLFPLPLRLLCANLILLTLAPLNLLFFNRASACMAAGGSSMLGMVMWLALMQQVPCRRGATKRQQQRGPGGGGSLR